MAVARRVALKAADALLAIAFAPQCAACGTALERPSAGCVCPSCWAQIEPPPAAWRSEHLALALAGGDHTGTLRHIVHAFKYDGRRSLARPLAGLMRTHGGDVLDGAACAVPVPLHPWRRLRRGFNQASDLAGALDLPVVHALWRTRWTGSQAGRSAAARRRGVRAAFRVSPLLATRTRALVEGRTVLLVDDVRTTGATLEACAVALAAAGAKEVRALTASVSSGE